MVQPPCLAQRANGRFNVPLHMPAGNHQVMMSSYNMEITASSTVSVFRSDHLYGTNHPMNQARILKQQIKVSTTHCAHPSPTPRRNGSSWTTRHIYTWNQHTYHTCSHGIVRLWWNQIISGKPCDPLCGRDRLPQTFLDSDRHITKKQLVLRIPAAQSLGTWKDHWLANTTEG